MPRVITPRLDCFVVWTSLMSGPIDIKCPDCGRLANFEEPFEFLSPGQRSPAGERPSEGRPVHKWGQWSVVERFPAQFAWKAPSASARHLRGGRGNEERYPLLTNGLVLCSNCHANGKHKLAWPSDAYWQWEIRGRVLWACDRRHAELILKVIRQGIRPPRYSPWLRHIPSHFLSAKVRSEVVRKIEASLRA